MFPTFRIQLKTKYRLKSACIVPVLLWKVFFFVAFHLFALIRIHFLLKLSARSALLAFYITLIRLWSILVEKKFFTCLLVLFLPSLIYSRLPAIITIIICIVCKNFFPIQNVSLVHIVCLSRHYTVDFLYYSTTIWKRWANNLHFYFSFISFSIF